MKGYQLCVALSVATVVFMATVSTVQGGNRPDKVCRDSVTDLNFKEKLLKICMNATQDHFKNIAHTKTELTCAIQYCFWNLANILPVLNEGTCVAEFTKYYAKIFPTVAQELVAVICKDCKTHLGKGLGKNVKYNDEQFKKVVGCVHGSIQIFFTDFCIKKEDTKSS